MRNINITPKMSRVDIGFAEKCKSWQVESRFFPSKIGGKPAWLSLENLPKLEELECKTCNKRLTFLCQVYAPYEEDETNFHRTLFIFVCRCNICCKRNTSENIKVFRSSIPRVNKFYPFEPPNNQKDKNFSLSKWLRLCELCGGEALKQCGKCKVTYYCCRDHQTKDWRENHKDICEHLERPRKKSRYLFPEYELVIESEEIDEEEPATNETEELEKYKQLQSEGGTGSLEDIPAEEIEALTSLKIDKTFGKFKKRIAKYPDQVLRYERGGEPLWIAEGPIPGNIPNCEGCGGERQFEFQIMPQMLSVLQETAIDWGILAVYTCKISCNIGMGYQSEYVFKQDVAEN